MSDPVRDLAALIVAAAAGGHTLEAIEGVVTADDGGGTVTVNLAGTVVPGCQRADSYASPAAGDKVLVFLVGNRPWVVCKSAVP